MLYLLNMFKLVFQPVSFSGTAAVNEFLIKILWTQKENRTLMECLASNLRVSYLFPWLFSLRFLPVLARKTTKKTKENFPGSPKCNAIVPPNFLGPFISFYSHTITVNSYLKATEALANNDFIIRCHIKRYEFKV